MKCFQNYSHESEKERDETVKLGSCYKAIKLNIKPHMKSCL